MYVGNQVIRFETKFKASDLGGLGTELTDRKGTGNYVTERTEFNYVYVPLTEPNLKSQVYYMLNKNDIYYSTNKNTNLLNGAIVTSGKEFFQSMGMNFVDSGRINQTGKNKGKPILIPDIKSEEDIPKRVQEFFDDSYKFLEDLVGKENIVYAAVHYDEDTPHMHFYFLPVVNEVKRKVFETDENGNLLKREVTGKDGTKNLVPIQKKDKDGHNIFETIKGKFLNCDQFWKKLGGKTSYAKIQDKYNEFINKKGFKLDRGRIGSNIEHVTKGQHIVDELQKQIENMKEELSKNVELNRIELNVKNEIDKLNKEEVLNPVKKKITGYKDEDVNNLIDYSKSVKKSNIKNKKELAEKNLEINSLSKKITTLSNENKKLKDGTAIKERDSIIKKQKKIIEEKNSIIDSLNNKIEKLNEKISSIIIMCKNVYKALAHKIGIHYSTYEEVDYDEIDYYADRINQKYDYKKQDKSNDYEMHM